MIGQFGWESTSEDVLAGVNLRGKRVLVTGISAGLGVETARALSAHGAHVVGAVRNLDKTRAATERIRAQFVGNGGLELVELDLASLASVRRCADALLAAGNAFDVVIANAGVLAYPKRTTEDGFEAQFGINYLGHFVLVNRIKSLMKRGSRLVNLSSVGHRFYDVDLDDLNFERSSYTDFAAYGRSKTATILFTVEFDRRHRADGMRAAAVHPGGIQTELSRYVPPEVIKAMVDSVKPDASTNTPPFKWKTIPQGAATTLWSGLVAPPDLIGGHYCEDCHVAEVFDGPGRRGVRSYALDPQRAQSLWARSEAMVGERF
jgi:NAD(P)-dependent dehydrogenase (short-subunit alcohol dehydrogenase family)